MTVTNPNEPESLEPLRIIGFDQTGITPLTESNRVDVRFNLSRQPTQHEVAASDTNNVEESNTSKVNLVANRDTIVIPNVQINKLEDWVRAANACLSMYEDDGYRQDRLESQIRDVAIRQLTQIDFEKL